jgi:hypothetical protein
LASIGLPNRQEQCHTKESARFRFNSAIFIEDSSPRLGPFGSVIPLNGLGKLDAFD